MKVINTLNNGKKTDMELEEDIKLIFSHLEKSGRAGGAELSVGRSKKVAQNDL